MQTCKPFNFSKCSRTSCCQRFSSSLPFSIRDATSDAYTPQCPSFCTGTLTDESLIHDYVCGDTRLGPKRLPTHLPLGSLLDAYDQFGGLCPGQFLAKWFNFTTGYYNYPPVNGFQLNTAAAPIEGTITFPVVVVKYPYNYHVYQVLLQFTALSGPIVAWLGQLRQGVQ
jgi:hypothetical protein